MSSGSIGKRPQVTHHLQLLFVPALCLLIAFIAFLTVNHDDLLAADPENLPPVGPEAVTAKISKLIVEPPAISLRGANREQQVVVTAVDPAGAPFDVTRKCRMSCTNTEVAEIHGAKLVGRAEGEAELIVHVGDHESRVAVHVTNFGTYPPVHFANDVVPILSKLGCNSGGCHGKAAGQNGFKLSVFGFDPQADYNAVVKEGRGRRVFPASPPESLILAKPTARIPHGGGQRLKEGSKDYELLLEWIRQGMPLGRPDAPRVVALRVSPQERVMRFGAEQQILAAAVYSDGTTRDVTDASLYASNASLVGEVDREGLVRIGRMPGEVAITINYMGSVAVCRFQVPRQGTDGAYPEFATHNKVDAIVGEKLRKMVIIPSALADDSTFLRRVFLDTIGTLPTPQETQEFLADPNPNKRARSIDQLLARDEYADFWALQWADILLVDRNKLAERGAFELHRWLREQFFHNRPYDEWVRELITATGSSGTNGPVNFYRAVDTPDALARTVSQAFLGVRLECAQCHHHPFDKWSQDDFYGLAGFFNGVERKPLGDRVWVYHAGYRETRVPVSDRLVPTKPLVGEVPQGLDKADPRVFLARWMTDPQNPWFARLVANRLWKHFLGRGLVEPEDDLRSTNPATNDALLDYLTEQVVQQHYDLKAIMRLILNSRVYQLSSATNETNRDDEQYFSHHYVKRLPAEVLLDAISTVTGSAEKFPGMRAGTRAIEIWDNRFPSYFLETFGRPERTSPCECARSSEPSISQALHLMNAPELEAKITSSGGRVAALINAGANRESLTEELCLAALSRPPGAKERRVAQRLFEGAPLKSAAQDFLWTLLNSYEFLFVQ